MDTHIAIVGNQKFNVLLDIVDVTGKTVRHVSLCNNREHAQRIADRIIACDSIQLASLDLPIANYVLVLHAVDRLQQEKTAKVPEVAIATPKYYSEKCAYGEHAFCNGDCDCQCHQSKAN